MLILFYYDDWILGRLRLYLLEINPGVFLFPKNYSKNTQTKIEKFIKEHGNIKTGYIYIRFKEFEFLNIQGNLPRREISTIDGIIVTSRKRT